MKPKEIEELVRIVEKSSIDEIEITKWWGRRVRIRKSAAPALPQTVEYVVPQAPVAPVHTEPSPTLSADPPTASVQVAGATTDITHYVEVKAPMVGTFYRAPNPEADPYVKEGDVVAKGQILCIIEAMKLMNEIEAEVNGRIVKILAENAQPIEFSQSLFLVDPS